MSLIHHPSFNPFPPPPQILQLRLGAQHQFRTDVFLEIRLAQRFQLHGAFLEREALSVGVFGDLGRLVVADDGVEAGD